MLALRSFLIKGSKFTITWAIKLKSNGTCQRRLNAWGYEKVDGSYYASNSIATPVTNPITVQIVFMLDCMNSLWTSATINVEGAFLQGCFENGKELYVEVPDGFNEWYQGDIVLHMNVLLYGISKRHTVFQDICKACQKHD